MWVVGISKHFFKSAEYHSNKVTHRRSSGDFVIKSNWISTYMANYLRISKWTRLESICQCLANHNAEQSAIYAFSYIINNRGETVQQFYNWIQNKTVVSATISLLNSEYKAGISHRRIA